VKKRWERVARTNAVTDVRNILVKKLDKAFKNTGKNIGRLATSVYSISL